MKSLVTIVLLLAVQLHAQDMDTELTTLASKLAVQIKENGKKKVAVIDFADLQGRPSGELGKYVAEQLTIDLVIIKKDFAVLDRANLNRILAEHKLTATGLIDPENAKKLGMFAGVDALVLGTIIGKGSNTTLTAKLITTDTAEIVGAARTEFKSDETVHQLTARTNKVEEASTDKPKRPPPMKLFGDLQARIESFQLQPGDNIYGFANFSIVITNTSETKTWGVAFPTSFYNNVHLNNNRGEEFNVTEVSGIETVFETPNGYQGAMTDIPPLSAISLLAKSQVRWTGNPGDYRPYRFQTTVTYGEENQGRHPFPKKFSLALEVK